MLSFPTQMDDQQLVGRSEESAILASCLSASLPDGKSAVLIRGRPGFGKSYLVTRFARQAQQQGVLVGRCSLITSNRDTPYSLWIRILEDLMVALEREAPGEAPATWVFGEDVAALEHIVPHLVGTNPKPLASATLRSQITYDLVRLFARLVHRSPVLLILDNLQFADESSLAVFRDLCHALPLQDQLTLCVTVREPYDVTSPHLAAAIFSFINELQAYQILLKPFTREDVATFLASCGAEPTVELVDEVYRTTEGNPLFVAQFGAVDAHGCRDLTGKFDSATTESVETRIFEYFQLRLNELHAQTRLVLGSATVLGGEFTIAELSAVVGDVVTPDSLEDSVRDAVFHSLLEEIPNTTNNQALYRFYHELVRTAVIHATAITTLQEAHSRMATYLMEIEHQLPPEDEIPLGNLLSRGKQLARIGNHLLRSGRPASLSAGVDRLLQAGELFLSGGAWEDAEGVFTRLLAEHSDNLPLRDAGRVACGRGKVRLFDGRKHESFAFLRSAIDRFAAAGDSERLVEAALQPVLLEPGHTPLLGLLRHAAATLQESDQNRPRLDAYDAVARALIAGEFERSFTVLDAILRSEALEDVSPIDGLRARGFLAFLQVRLSRFPEARDTLDQMQEIATAEYDPVTACIVAGAEFEIARINGELHRARDIMLRRQAVDERIGDRSLRTESSLRLGRLAFRDGDLPVARRYLRQALHNDPDHPQTQSNLIMLECTLGHYEEAETLLQPLVDRAEAQDPGPHPVFVAAAAALATMALFSDTSNRSMTESRLLQAYRMVRRARDDSPEHPYIATRRQVISAVIAYHLSRPEESEHLLAELTHATHYHTIDPGHIERARGLLHFLSSSWDGGARYLERAAMTFRKSNDLPRVVLVESEYTAELFVKDPVTAEVHRKRLVSTCRQHGLLGLEDRLTRISRSADILKPSPDIATLLQRLTIREREVLGLLAKGMSDKEIAACLTISNHTASNHVRHILTKSGCVNRTQAVARLTAQDFHTST